MKTRVMFLMAFILFCGLNQVKAEPVLFEHFKTHQDDTSNFYTNYWNAQTFTPSTDHTINEVRLWFYNVVGSPGKLIVSVKATDALGNPTGSDLCFGTYDANTITANPEGELVGINLGMGTDLASGTKYAIVIRSPSGSKQDYLMQKGSNLGGYDGGDLRFSSDAGLSWTDKYSIRDLYFEELGVPEPTTALLLIVFLITGILFFRNQK